MPKPNTADYPEYFGRYIDQVPENDLNKSFEIQLPIIKDFLNLVTEERSNFAYATGKWTLKEMLQHLIDAERIFNYRALSFARKETASLPSFEENLYAENSNANNRTWLSLKEEFINARKSTEDLFKSFTDDMLNFVGMANDKRTTALSMGFISVGHVYHHIKVAKERYLN